MSTSSRSIKTGMRLTDALYHHTRLVTPLDLIWTTSNQLLPHSLFEFQQDDLGAGQ